MGFGHRSFLNVPTCETKSTIVFIKSAIEHRTRRDLFRRLYSKLGVPYRFVVGRNADMNVDERVLVEIQSQNDTVVGDFEDTYRNLAKKTYFTYKYARDKCANAQYMVTHDDDTLCDFARIAAISSPIACLGSIMRNKRAHRLGKWQLSPSHWPGGYYFPVFCNGAGVMLSADSVAKISQQFEMLDEAHRDFPLEDVLFNGVLRSLAAVDEIADYGGVCEHLGETRSEEAVDTLLDERITSVEAS